MPPQRASSELVRAYPTVGPGSAPGGEEQAHRVVRASLAARELSRRVSELATQRTPVLILGETGTGKTLIARTLHGAQQPGALLSVNCASLADTQLARLMCDQLAGPLGSAGDLSRATLLLDEIGELSPWGQAVLLRALSSCEASYLPRIVSATHRDLEAMVRAGKFSGELLMRLRGTTLQMIPLRERPEEIAPLALHFLRLTLSMSRTPFVSMDPMVLAHLEQHSWPGNVRELQNTMGSALTHSTNGLLSVESLPDQLRDSDAHEL